MIESERHELIIQIVKRNRIAALHDITEMTHASEATVRRDLAKLEENGLIRRVRGGAELLESAVSDNEQYGEVPFEYRKGLLIEKKRLIGKQAAGLCRNGETIIIDGGSTTFQMAEYLYPLECKVITNSFAIAELLLNNSRNQVIIPGGMIYRNSQLILDPFQGNFFENYAASKVFMGVGGIGPKGLTNTDPLLIQTERMMIEHADEVIILADSSKFKGRGNLLLCGYNRISSIITDSGIAEEHRGMLDEYAVPVIVV